MTSTRYINDMIIRYYTLTKAIREISEDTSTFYTPEDRDVLVNSLTQERTAIKKMLDRDLADSAAGTRSTSAANS